MQPDEIWTIVEQERLALADLLDGLTAEQWETPSLCSSWRVRDVVAHLVLATKFTVPVLVFELIRARGNVDRLIADTAIRYAAKPIPELAAESRAIAPSRKHAIGTTPVDRLMDTLVHFQDIAVPLGVRREMPAAAARVSLERVWATFGADRKFAGLRFEATDSGWSAGAGPLVAGPTSALLLTATGRRIGFAELSGDGVAAAQARD